MAWTIIDKETDKEFGAEILKYSRCLDNDAMAHGFSSDRQVRYIRGKFKGRY
jgi:hypothetical protein